MKGRAILAVVIGVWSATLALAAIAVALIVIDHRAAYDLLFYVPEVLAFATAGALVAWRRPRIMAGWLLFVVGLVWTLVGALHAYVNHALADGPGVAPTVAIAAWVANWIWMLAFGAMWMFFLLFPNGRLPSPRWRVIAWVGAAGGALVLIGRGLMPGPLAEFPEIVNPISIHSGGVTLRVADTVGNQIVTVVLTASIVSLVVRYRHADGVIRRQLLWMAVAGVVFIALASLGDIAQRTGAVESGNLFIAAFAGIPIAAAIAILKYRLYDIDRVVSKMVVYGALAVLVTTVFVTVVVGLGAAIGIQGQPNLALSVLATALVAVIFQPVRKRLQGLANRMVYGRRASPYEVLAGFARRMGEPIATEALLPVMARTLAEGSGATQAAVWLAVGTDLRSAAVWPGHAGEAQPIRMVDGDPPSWVDGTKTLPIRHRGELLGALSVTKPPGEPLTPAEDKLISDLAAQAGLALRNVRLIEELKASRQRIVSAQDAERRRLERDIHDGAQQRLVTLSLALRMARTRPGLTPALAAALDTAARELSDGLSELRELARGVHPALLTDEGLGPALTSLAERSPVAARLASAPAARLPAPVEATAYQVASRAVAAAADAGACAVRISAEHVGGTLTVEVADDATREDGAERRIRLDGIDDRVAALDGRVEIENRAGRGAVVRAVIPCESY